MSICLHIPAFVSQWQVYVLKLGMPQLHNILAYHRKMAILCLSKSCGQLNTLTGICILLHKYHTKNLLGLTLAV